MHIILEFNFFFFVKYYNKMFNSFFKRISHVPPITIKIQEENNNLGITLIQIKDARISLVNKLSRFT